MDSIAKQWVFIDLYVHKVNTKEIQGKWRYE